MKNAIILISLISILTLNCSGQDLKFKISGNTSDTDTVLKVDDIQSITFSKGLPFSSLCISTNSFKGASFTWLNQTSGKFISTNNLDAGVIFTLNKLTQSRKLTMTLSGTCSGGWRNSCLSIMLNDTKEIVFDKTEGQNDYDNNSYDIELDSGTFKITVLLIGTGTFDCNLKKMIVY